MEMGKGPLPVLEEIARFPHGNSNISAITSGLQGKVCSSLIMGRFWLSRGGAVLLVDRCLTAFVELIGHVCGGGADTNHHNDWGYHEVSTLLNSICVEVLDPAIISHNDKPHVTE